MMPLTDREIALLNPHLVKLLDLQSYTGTEPVPPGALVSPARFDLAVKHLYARHRDLGSLADVHVQVYAAHIGVFSRRTFKEDDGSKSCLMDFIRNFDRVLDSVEVDGFDPTVSIVPVGRQNVPLDGSHRVAACLYHHGSLDVARFDVDAPVYNSEGFATGMTPQLMELATLEYCRLHPNVRVVTQFPSAMGHDDEVRTILSQYGTIIHEKNVGVAPTQGAGVIQELYLGERWLGTWRDGFGGAQGKAGPCFDGTGPLRVFIVQAKKPDSMAEAKKEIRKLFEAGQDSIHSTDTQVESLRVARTLLSDNSIAFINRFQNRYFEQLEGHLDRWREWLEGEEDEDAYCVDGGCVLGACGLRAPGDLDVLHATGVSLPGSVAESNNGYAGFYPVSTDRIVFDPRCHFWTRGIKFAMPAVVESMKRFRGGDKDITDAGLLYAFRENLPFGARP